MTKELLNELMNALVDGTLFGICFSFWIMILITVWRWFLGIVKRFLHWLCPKWFKPKPKKLTRTNHQAAVPTKCRCRFCKGKRL